MDALKAAFGKQLEKQVSVLITYMQKKYERIKKTRLEN